MLAAIGMKHSHLCGQVENVLEPNTQITLALGSSVTSLEFLAANRLRGWALQWMSELFRESRIDAIVGPTVGVSTPRLLPKVSVDGIGRRCSLACGRTSCFGFGFACFFLCVHLSCVVCFVAGCWVG
jgi:hypothetical protein